MIAPRHAKLAAYERELIGLVTAVKHWRPYLWGRTFIIRSDHYSLKYILDQRLSTIPQHQWVSKLLGYDFSVEYKPGRHNIVADALSRKETAASLMSLSEIQFPIFNQLKEVSPMRRPQKLLLPSPKDSSLHLGNCRTASFFTKGGYMFLHPPQFFTIYYTLFMMLLMKDQRKHSIDSN